MNDPVSKIATARSQNTDLVHEFFRHFLNEVKRTSYSVIDLDGTYYFEIEQEESDPLGSNLSQRIGSHWVKIKCGMLEFVLETDPRGAAALYSFSISHTRLLATNDRYESKRGVISLSVNSEQEYAVDASPSIEGISLPANGLSGQELDACAKNFAGWVLGQLALSRLDHLRKWGTEENL